MSRGGNIKNTAVAADAAVTSNEGYLWGGLLTAAGTATATLIVYDNTAASGTKVLELSALTGTSVPVLLEHPVKVSNGLYADIGGTGASAFVFWE